MRIALGRTRRVGGPIPTVGSARQTWTERHGLVLRLETATGLVGWGEASPLPGYSPDRLEDVEQRLRTIDWGALAFGDDADLGAVASLSAELAPPTLPSARFAIETALGDLIARRRKQPLWQWLDGPERGPVPLSTVITARSTEAALAEARAAVARGVRTLKLKIGRADGRSSEQALLAALDAAFAPQGITLRLDANGALPPGAVVERLESLAALSIELVEEPAPLEILAALSPLPLPIALDESLARPDAWHLLDRASHHRWAAVVIKPALLGGFAPAMRAAAEARARGLDVLVSHLFDGPVGLAAGAQLALAVASRTRPSGLDVHGALDALGQRPIPYLGAAHIEPSQSPGLGLDGEPS